LEDKSWNLDVKWEKSAESIAHLSTRSGQVAHSEKSEGYMVNDWWLWSKRIIALPPQKVQGTRCKAQGVRREQVVFY
jgi:hypothetical protein